MYMHLLWLQNSRDEDIQIGDEPTSYSFSSMEEVHVHTSMYTYDSRIYVDVYIMY